MENTFFENITSTLSNHFELLIYISASSAALFFLTLVAVKFSDIRIQKVFHATIKGLLFTFIIVGQIVLCVILGYLYWINYRKPAPEIKLADNLIATTHWVKEDVRVYFINNKILRSVKVNGQDRKDVFQANELIKEYYFSPDGAFLLVLTQNDLFFIDQKTGKNYRIDGLKKINPQESQEEKESIDGSIGGIQWAPDSQKFVYEIARWSKYATQDNVYIYTVKDRTRRSIKSPTRRISSLYWGRHDNNLYFFRHQAQDPSIYSSAFEVKVFRIPLSTLTPEFVTQIPFDKFSVPIENLNFRDIELFFGGTKLSFGRPTRDHRAVSANGSIVGVDEEDYLYTTKTRWFRKRLFRIPREINKEDMTRYHYKGGDLVIDHIRWIPGGRYVIMEHKYWGVLILEPSTGRIGSLIQAHGRAFGWYQRDGT